MCSITAAPPPCPQVVAHRDGRLIFSTDSSGAWAMSLLLPPHYTDNHHGSRHGHGHGALASSSYCRCARRAWVTRTPEPQPAPHGHV